MLALAEVLRDEPAGVLVSRQPVRAPRLEASLEVVAPAVVELGHVVADDLVAVLALGLALVEDVDAREVLDVYGYVEEALPELPVERRQRAEVLEVEPGVLARVRALPLGREELAVGRRPQEVVTGVEVVDRLLLAAQIERDAL